MQNIITVSQGGVTVQFREAKMTSGWKATYRKVHIDIFYDHKDYDSLGKPKGPKQFYFVLRRAGAPRSGPEMSKPGVFLNSSASWREKTYSTARKAMKGAIGAIHEGYPRSEYQGMSRNQALAKLDLGAQALKDDINRYAEMAALTEEEYERCIRDMAAIQRRLKLAGMRLAGADVLRNRIPEWKRGGNG